jgi:hypothetical protein
MTKTEAKRINAQIRELQAERKDILTGRYLPTGMPWCRGPGGLGHQEPGCEGCCVREYYGHLAEPLLAQISELKALLAPPIEAPPIEPTAVLGPLTLF